MRLKNIDNGDDNMFVYPSKITQVFITLSRVKNKKAVGFDGVPAEVLESSLPVNFFFN